MFSSIFFTFLSGNNYKFNTIQLVIGATYKTHLNALEFPWVNNYNTNFSINWLVPFAQIIVMKERCNANDSSVTQWYQKTKKTSSKLLINTILLVIIVLSIEKYSYIYSDNNKIQKLIKFVSDIFSLLMYLFTKSWSSLYR